MKQVLKRNNIRNFLFSAICVFGLVSVLAACESPRVVNHPVSRGDTYYYYVTFYGDEYQGKTMANGEAFSNDAMTCAAKGFPFGTVLEVQSLETGKKVEVTVTDRPGKEVVDLTIKAFETIDSASKGKIRAKIKVVGLSDGAPAAAAAGAEKAEEEKNEPKEEQKVADAPEKKEDVKKENSYAITLATFGDIDAAKAYQSEVKEENTYIFTRDGKFEVRYGRYASEDEAKADIERFSWKDADIVIIEE